MAQEKLLTVRDVSQILGVSEKEVIDLAESGSIPAYKVAGVYLRFKKEQVDDFKKNFKYSNTVKKNEEAKYSFKDRLADFIYFNDFYIFSFLAIVLILFFIFST